MKGATGVEGGHGKTLDNFNPRTREGCDSSIILSVFWSSRHFNPRTREGCDGAFDSTSVIDDDISIHAPVKGATVAMVCNQGGNDYFNPRTREGCDVDRVHKYLLAHRISIHAPVKGATTDTS